MANTILEALRELRLNEAKQDIDNFINKFGNDTYQLFKKSIQRLKNNNISTDLVWHTKHTEKKELENILNNLQNRVITKDLKSDKFEGDYEYLGEDKGYKVYHIKDHIASMNLGSGTGWCISGRYGHYGEVNYKPTESEAKKHWDEYVKQDIKFYFFIGRKDKYALAVYPKITEIDRLFSYPYETNFELYDEKDELDIEAINKLPTNLINHDQELKILSSFNSEGLFITTTNELSKAKDDVTNVIIPNSVRGIRDCVFADCKSLESVIIPDTVTVIGESAFNGCINLESIAIPDSITRIPDVTFRGCSKLKNIKLSSNLNYIGYYAFADCYSLEDIVIPDSVKSIGSNAFENCTSLKNITLPSNPNFSFIDYCTFRGCTSLESIVIPEGVLNIDQSAFWDCTNLISITLPESIYTIDEEAFEGCEKLRDIYYQGTEESWNLKGLSDSLPENVTVHFI